MRHHRICHSAVFPSSLSHYYSTCGIISLYIDSRFHIREAHTKHFHHFLKLQFIFTWQSKSFSRCWLEFKETVIAYCSFFAAPCGGAVTGQSGVIESNGYPTQPYTDDLFCEWRSGDPWDTISPSTLEDFNLQNSSGCERDFVEIWENHTSGQ